MSEVGGAVAPLTLEGRQERAREVRGDTPMSIGIGGRPNVPKPQSWGAESPTPSVHSGLRARVAQLAHAGPLNCSAGAFAALAVIDEEEAKANAARETALALLQEPRVGTTVTLKTGGAWTFGGRNWAYSSEEVWSYPVLDEILRDTLIAAVSSGAAYVTEGEA